MQTSVILITLSYLSGILLGRGFLYFPFAVAITTSGAFIAFAFITKWKRTSFSRFLLVALPVLFGMASYVYSAAWFPAGHYTRTFTIDKKKHEITGTITSPLDRDPDRFAFIMAVHEIDGVPVSGKMRVSVRDANAAAGYGDTLLLTGRVYEPRKFHNPGGFDYPAYLSRSGIYASASVKNSDAIRIIKHGRGMFRTIQDWRERIRQSFLASTTGEGSAVLQAMILGEEGRLTDDIRDRFMAAGVTHILSISGSHLGLVAILCFGIVRGILFLLPERAYHRLTLRADPRKIAVWIALPLVVFYALLAGGQVATIRSLIMISAALAALVLDRANGLMHSLAVAALLILFWNPQAIFDISFQLSYLSVLTIGYVVMLWNDLQIKAPDLYRKLRNSAVLMVLISLCTSAATGPLVAHHFNQFSLAGVISNVIVVPLAGIAVVPLGLISGILSLFFHHLPLASLNQFMAAVFFRMVALFSRLPFAEFHPRSPGLIWLALYVVFVISLAGHVRERLLYRFRPLEYSARKSGPQRALIVISGTLLALSFTLPLFSSPGTRVSFLDVGQGDCTLIQLPSGRNILIDGGGTHDGRFDIGRRVVAPYLWDNGVRTLDLVILSHPHPDHMNGLRFILKKFRVSEVWDGGQEAGLPACREFTQIIAQRGIRHRTVKAAGEPYFIGDAKLTLLHPGRGCPSCGKKASARVNNHSLVVRVEAGGKSFLFPGDIEKEAETELVRNHGAAPCDLLKVPHHGGKSSNTDGFVNAVRPRIAVMSAGKDNPYHHPSEEVIARYERSGAKVFRTDLDGAVFVSWDKDHATAVGWADFEFQRIRLAHPGQWAERERENRNRVLRRFTW